MEEADFSVEINRLMSLKKASAFWGVRDHVEQLRLHSTCGLQHTAPIWKRGGGDEGTRVDGRAEEGCGSCLRTENHQGLLGQPGMRDTSQSERHTLITQPFSVTLCAPPTAPDAVHNVFRDHRLRFPQTLGAVWPIGSGEVDPSHQTLREPPDQVRVQRLS